MQRTTGVFGTDMPICTVHWGSTIGHLAWVNLAVMMTSAGAPAQTVVARTNKIFPFEVVIITTGRAARSVTESLDPFYI